MSFFRQLTQDYRSTKPKYFDVIAQELHKGISLSRISSKLMDDHGLSRLAAGKTVENVQRKIKMMKVNLVTGFTMVFIGFIFFLLNSGSIFSYILFFFGSLQLYAGLNDRKEYKMIVSSPALNSE